jgi:hypothetical protein
MSPLTVSRPVASVGTDSRGPTSHGPREFFFAGSGARKYSAATHERKHALRRAVLCHRSRPARQRLGLRQSAAAFDSQKQTKEAKASFGFDGFCGIRGRKAPAAVAPKRRFGAPRTRKDWRSPKPGGSSGEAESSSISLNSARLDWSAQRTPSTFRPQFSRSPFPQSTGLADLQCGCHPRGASGVSFPVRSHGRRGPGDGLLARGPSPFHFWLRVYRRSASANKLFPYGIYHRGLLTTRA